MFMFIPEVEKIKDKIIGVKLSPRRIANIINKVVYKTYGAEVKAISSKQLDPGQMTVNAYFDYEDWREFDNIEIYIIYSSKFKRRIIMTESSWRELSFKLYQALQHEQKHCEQCKKRNGIDPWTNNRQNEKGWYFQDPDEIDTHAHDIALELLFFGYSVDDALQKLKQYSKINLRESITLFAYMTYFQNDISNPCLTRLVKRTVKYLEEKRNTFLCSPLQTT